jgi:spore coat protein CotF
MVSKGDYHPHDLSVQIKVDLETSKTARNLE